MLIFDDLDGRPPSWPRAHPMPAVLAPGSPDAGRVVVMTAGLAAIRAPCPVAAAPPAARELAGLVHGWRALAADPPAGLDAWARRHLPRLAGLQTGWLMAPDRDTLLHGGINASNLLISQDQKVWLTGWAQPARRAAWIDVAGLIPHLILAGHPPARAEHARAAVPAWTATPPAVITSYAAAFTGYRARSSRLPARPASPASAPTRPTPPRPPSPGPPTAPTGPRPRTHPLNRAGQRSADRAATRCRRASRGPARRRPVQ